ncbi:cache domain-containing protein [Aeromonas allosaccharophila]|uniref:Cache domain-containing protein n=1 Tax=Aeromonas allosaccharophila TaxID=656 RepID=A0AAX3NKP5_9GAMM|nr:cache domain-containing protein [Aeromonas allosaccharophila]WED74711.1 cache domain-containing protein [Aeromonas allosaccharophila]
MNLIRRVIPLYVHIAHLFLGLLLVFALITLGHQYQQTKTMLMNEAEERFSLIGQLTTQELEGLFRSSALSVNLLAQQRLTEANTLAARMANIPYMATLLTGQPSANGVYAGYNNGDMFRLMRWPADTDVQHLTPPANTRWIVQSVRHLESATLTDIFALADNLAIIAHKQVSGLTFDAREHPWFIQAKQAGRLVQTPPYISLDSQEMYLSFAKPMQNGAGIIGVSLNLRSIEHLLKSAMITPNMRLAIVNEQGELITSHKGGMIIHGEKGKYRLAKVTEADLPMLQHLIDASQRQHIEKLTFQSEERDWQGMHVELPEADESRLSLWIAAPVDELLAKAITIRNQTFLLSGIFLILALLAAIKLARTAARPLDTLTQEAGKIAHFDFNEPVRVNTYIAEIIDLSQAMGDMKSTIQRFLQLSTSLSSQGESVNILLNFTQFFETRIEYRFQIFTAHSCDFLLPSYARLA